MPRERRRNIFFRAGVMCEQLPGNVTARVESVSGRFEDLLEQVRRKLRRSTHWLVLELDADEYGPLTGVYFDARDFKAASIFEAMCREGVVLKQGDDIRVSAGKGGYPELSVNGSPVTVVPDPDNEAYYSREGSFGALLDSIRGAHREIDFIDEAETEYLHQVRELLSERIRYADGEELRDLVHSAYLPDMERDSSFEDILHALEKALKA